MDQGANFDETIDAHQKVNPLVQIEEHTQGQEECRVVLYIDKTAHECTSCLASPLREERVNKDVVIQEVD